MKYKISCERHGELSPQERIKWTSNRPERWCLHCVNEMMDKFCGKITVTKIEDNQTKES